MNRITAKLADVATISFAGSRMTPGFGSIEQHAAEIEREDFRSIDFSTSVEFGKFFPERWRLRIPMYYAYSRQSTLPEYDPLDSDIPLEVALDNAANRHLRDSIKRNAEDYVMRKSLNFTNVGIESKDGKSHFFDWSNLSLTYSYNKSFARNVNLERDLEKNYRGLISYIYNGMPPIVEPFKKSKSKTLNSKYLRLIKDFNFYYMPSMFSITSDITRNYREVKSKNLDNPNLLIEPTYDKDFMWTRDYAFKFNLTRNLVVDFHATTQARIDEPEGIVDRQRDPERYQQWKDTVWNNILDGGRPVNYNHDFSVQYTVPVNKLPFLDWTSLQLGYSTRYDWQAAAVTADSTNLGNVIRNASALQMNGDLSLTSLYNKSKFLREMIRPPRKQRGKNVKFETGMDKVQKGKPVVVRHRLKTGDIQARLTAADGKNIKLGYESVGRNKIRINSSETLEGGKLLVTGTETPHAGVGNAVARFFVGILTGFKTLSVGYSEDKGTTLPGFLPEARWLGQQSYNGSSAPGFKFLFGGQDENFGLKAAGKGWITTDSTQNNPFLMNASRTVYVRALFEPIKKLRVNLTSNWRVVYTGLIDFAFMKKVFKSISVNHNYICKYNIGSFASNLKYAEDARDLQDNWMSLFDVNLVSINEQFNPLISMDMVWANNLTTHWDINRRRDVSLSLVNAQLSETSSNEIVLGLGYRFGNLPIFLKSKQLNNDINVQFDFSIRKNNTIIRRITENVDQLTAGEKVMSIKVSADYTFNNRLNLRLFYDRKVDTPYLSLSYPTTNTNFGLSIRYTLMQ
jgi:gliding motility-related protein